MAITTQMRTDVANLYVALFGRAPERDGLGYWVNQLGNGTALADVAQAMFNVDAARAYYPTFLTNEEIVGKFYTNVLGRTADADGLAYWTAKLNAGQSAGSLIADMINAVKAYSGTDAAALTSQALFNNKVTAGLSYAVDLGGNDVAKATSLLATITSDPATVTAAVAAVTASSGQAYTLTTGVDNFVGTTGNDSFNATNTSTSATLGGLDKVDGGAGTDTLNVADTATAAGADFTLPAGFTMTNIEVLNVTTNGAIGTGGAAGAAGSFDVSTITGLTTASFVAAGAGTNTGSHVKAANTTDVSLTVAAANTATVDGGKAVTVTGGSGATSVVGSGLTSVVVNKGGAVTIDNTNTAGTTSVGTTLTSVTLNSVDANSAVKGAALTTLSIGGATTAARTVTVTNGTAGHTLTVNATGTGYDTLGTTEYQTVVTDTAATKAVVNTTAKSSLNLAGSTAVTALTLTGAGDLKLNPMGAATTTIDGSAATGKLNLGTLNAAAVTVSTGAGADTFTLSATTKATVATGAGNDIVTLGAVLAAGSSVSLGDGNDALLGSSLPATSVSATSVIDGGAGTDTVSIALINAGNASLFKNFENLSLGSTATVDASLMTGSTITGLSIDGGAGTSVLSNVTQAQALTVNATNAGGSSTLTFTGVTGSADAYSITFNGTTTGTTASPTVVDAGTVSINGIENVTVHSNAAAGVNNNTITLTASTLQTLVIDGSQAATVAFAGTNGTVTNGVGGVSLIDGSAATGKLSINEANVTAAAAGITIKGGSADDTLTTSTFASTLTGGQGKDNFVVTSAVYGAGKVVTTITDAAVGDKITLVDQGAETFTTTKVDVSAATNLATALGIAASGTNGSVNAAVKWFQYGGNTYVVEVLTNNATVTDAATTDLVVKLTGAIDLSTATGAGTHILTLA